MLPHNFLEGYQNSEIEKKSLHDFLVAAEKQV